MLLAPGESVCPLGAGEYHDHFTTSPIPLEDTSNPLTGHYSYVDRNQLDIHTPMCRGRVCRSREILKLSRSILTSRYKTDAPSDRRVRLPGWPANYTVDG